MQNKGAVSQAKGLRNESKTKCWFLEGMGMLNTAATWVLEWAEDQRKQILGTRWYVCQVLFVTYSLHIEHMDWNDTLPHKRVQWSCAS